MRKLLFTFLAVMALSALPLAAGTVCPGFSGDPIVDPSGCNTVITFDTNGVPSVVVTDTSPYDGVEDNLVGVVNNSSSTITSFSLSGSNIFGFDGDGICSFITCTTGDSSGYGPDGVSFTVTDANNGVVNFSPGIAGNGGTGFFSLEEPPTVSGGITVGGQVPEPNTVGMLGAALVGLVALARRRRAA